MKLGAMNHDLKQNVRARRMRSEMSVSEKVLWEQVRKNRLGYGFRRQVPVGPYILDFYCARASLCIEVDGEQHIQTLWRGREEGRLFARGRHRNDPHPELGSVRGRLCRLPGLDSKDPGNLRGAVESPPSE